MAKIVAGIGTSHVPSIGVAYDQGRTQEPDWKPLFDAYEPVKKWLRELAPDIAIVVYNDHGGDFFFDKYPTFAVGASAASSDTTSAASGGSTPDGCPSRTRGVGWSSGASEKESA